MMQTIEGKGSTTMKAGMVALIGLGLVVLLVVIGGVTFVSARNTMVTLNENVDTAYSAVDVEQQRRLDLIPNLVASVKGYVSEESTVLTNIANARAGVLAAAGNRPGSIQANEQLSAAIVPLFRLQEAYPNLKGNDQFLRLEDELAGTENRIQVARLRYNDALKAYNVDVKQFPGSLIAGAKFPPRDEYFKGNPQNGVAPTVDFSK
jgi:LemA protein